MLSTVKRLPAGTVLREIYTIGTLVTAGEGPEGPTYTATGQHGEHYLIQEVGLAAQASSAYRDAVKMIRTFSHPNLCRIIDNLVAHDREFIVLEAPQGPSLEAVVTARVPPSRRRVHVLLHQLCEVLGYLDARQPSFILHTLKPSEIHVDAAGHVNLHTYRLDRCFETDPVPLFSAKVHDRARNFGLLAELILFIMGKSLADPLSRRLDPLHAVITRLKFFVDNPGYTFQEASRSLGAALGTGVLLTGELAAPERSRRTTGRLYANTTVFKGLDRDGNVLSGQLQSDTLQAAVDKLRTQGVKVEDVHFQGWRDRLGARLRQVPVIPGTLVLLALCLVGGIYTFRHRNAAPMVAQHHRVLVATDDGSLLAIDAGTFAVHRLGKLPGPVSDIKTLDSGTVLAVLNLRGVALVRADNGQPIGAVPPWHQAVDQLLVSPDRNVLYCIDKQQGTIGVLSGPNLATQATITAAGRIGDAALSPDGRLLYVSLPGRRSIAAMDAVRGTRKSSFGVPGGPEVLALPQAGVLWVGCRDRVLRTVSLTTRNRPVATLMDFPGLIVALTGGFVLCDDGSVTTIQNNQKGRWLAGDGAGSPTFTLGPDGDLWLSSGRSPEIHRIDPLTASLDTRITLPATARAMDVAP